MVDSVMRIFFRKFVQSLASRLMILTFLLLALSPSQVSGKKRIDNLMGTTGFGTIQIPQSERDQIIARCFADGNTRIMDGTEVTDMTNFKFVAVILGDKKLPDGEIVGTTCGAVFIHSRLLLTAKHCVVDLYKIEIRYGGLRSRRDFSHAVILDSETTDDIIAINFVTQSDPTHDYAFVLLGDIDDSKVEYICLRRVGEDAPRLVTVMGWGAHESGETSTELRYTTLSTDISSATKDNQKCKAPMFCAGPQTADGKARIALGDSGGPVVQALAHTLIDTWEWDLKLYG